MAKLGGMDTIVESFGTPTHTPRVIRPTETVTPEEVPTQEVIVITPQEEITLTPTEENPVETVPTPTLSGESGAAETLRILEESVVPVNDQVDLGLRLQGLTDIPLTVLPPAAPRQVGERDTFWVIDTFAEDYFQVEAVLRYVTDHLYFWIEDGVRYDRHSLAPNGHRGSMATCIFISFMPRMWGMEPRVISPLKMKCTHLFTNFLTHMKCSSSMRIMHLCMMSTPTVRWLMSSNT
jgi:hypothetical protein